MNINIDLKKDNFEEVNTKIDDFELNNEKVLRVVKSNKIFEFDENTYAKFNDIRFHNGIIEVKMLSRLLPDAPDYARGFIGIAYRINEDDSQFESFYVRPTNGKTSDPVRKAHGCQYFSYPQYTFAYFREHNITKYEAPVNIGLDEWIDLKAIITNENAEFYINDSKEPTLIVNDMKHGFGYKGAIGFFVDIGTEAFFKELKVTLIDE